MNYTYGNKAPITKSNVQKIITFCVFGLALLFLLFILVKRFPGLMTIVQPRGGFQCYFYLDADGDGRGNPEYKILGKVRQEPPPGYTVVVGDCDDNNPNK